MENHFTTKQGFTLIELIVSLAIIVILITASVPTVRSLIIESRLKSAANSFAGQVMLARTEAIQKQQDVYLAFQPGTSWCYGTNANSSCSCSPSNNCGLSLTSSTDYSGVTTIADSGFSSSNNIHFDSVRGIPNETAQVSFQSEGRAILVTINIFGQASLCSSTVGGYPAC